MIRNNAHNPYRMLAIHVLMSVLADAKSIQRDRLKAAHRWMHSPVYERQRKFWLDAVGVSYDAMLRRYRDGKPVRLYDIPTPQHSRREA